MAQTHYSVFTVQSSQVPSTQTNYSVIIDWTDARFKTTGNGGRVANANGFDIRPYTATDLATPLSYVLLRFIATTGYVQMMVKVPSLADASIVVLGYGDAALSTDGSSKANTFDANWLIGAPYEDGTTLTGTDMTNNGNNVSSFTGCVADAGLFGGSCKFRNTQTGDRINYSASLAIPTTGAFHCWIKPGWPGNAGEIAVIGLNSAKASIPAHFDTLKYSDNNLYMGWLNGGTDARVQIAYASSGLTQNAWNFLFMNWNTSGPSTKVYINGTQRGSTNTNNGTWNTAGADELTIGNQGATLAFGNPADSWIDMFGLHNVERSADWATVQYKMGTQASFWGLGAEQAVSADVLFAQALL